MATSYYYIVFNTLNCLNLVVRIWTVKRARYYACIRYIDNKRQKQEQECSSRICVAADYLGRSILSDNITVVNNCFYSYRKFDLILIVINFMQTHIQLLCAYKTINRRAYAMYNTDRRTSCTIIVCSMQITRIRTFVLQYTLTNNACMRWETRSYEHQK